MGDAWPRTDSARVRAGTAAVDDPSRRSVVHRGARATIGLGRDVGGVRPSGRQGPRCRAPAAAQRVAGDGLAGHDCGRVHRLERDRDAAAALPARRSARVAARFGSPDRQTRRGGRLRCAVFSRPSGSTRHHKSRRRVAPLGSLHSDGGHRMARRAIAQRRHRRDPAAGTWSLVALRQAPCRPRPRARARANRCDDDRVPQREHRARRPLSRLRRLASREPRPAGGVGPASRHARSGISGDLAAVRRPRASSRCR